MVQSQPSTDRLELLFRVSQTFNSSLELDTVLNCVMDEVITATKAERGFLMLLDEGGEMTFRAARGVDQQTIESPQFEISRGVVEQVAREGKPTYSSDAQSDAALKKRESVVVLGLRSILCVPLQLKGDVIGVIYVDNRLQTGLFQPDDLDLLAAIGSSAVIAIENARLYQVAIDKGRIERELQVARELQTSLLPRETPHVDGWGFAALWKPAREVSGDFYDFVALAQEKLGIVIADVSDKGMAAALFMALSRSIVRASVTSMSVPSDAIAQANRLICADAANGMFVTLFYAQLDPVSGEVAYVNAGHNPPYLYRAAQDEFVELKLSGMALGVIDSAPYKMRNVQLNSGDFIFFYTDGVTDALAAEREEFFGEDRLRHVLREYHQASAVDLLAALEDAINNFTGPAAPFDDLTIVVAKRL